MRDALQTLSDVVPSSLDERTGETLDLDWHAPRGPWLLELGTSERTHHVVLQAGDRLVLGSGSCAGFRLRDPAVSARHCLLEATTRGLRVQDLGSKNGVFVGGARVGAALLPASDGHFVVGTTSVAVRAQRDDDTSGPPVSMSGIVGNSIEMQKVLRSVVRYAPLSAPVLVLGESGTGKDIVARALHDHGNRGGEYVPLNVGAIAESLADAELFGHCRGAFTGAVADRIGAFSRADGGTLFLDEVAELLPAVQVKLLRVVEDMVVRPVGSSKGIDVNVRLVSATWAPLAERVAEGRFRADLLHRLSTVVIELPPLRRRKSDIAALSRALLERYRPEIGPRRLSSAALARLMAHHWPGNVRELGSVLYRAAVLASGSEIWPEDIETALPCTRSRTARALSPQEAVAILEAHGGNVSAAARSVRVARSTFRAWLEKAR